VRTLPAYVEMEVTTEKNGACVYSPLSTVTRAPGTMSLQTYRHILAELCDFCGDLHLSLSYLGEPLCHPDIRTIIRETLERKEVRLILETDGRLFDPAFSDFVSSLGPANLSVIFTIDAVSPETYHRIWDADLGVVQRNLRYLLGKEPRPDVYAQLVRMKVNEEEMLPFFDLWEKEGAQVIIQKHNSFLGLLPKEEGSDLSPLRRIPCWHLQRDMVILHDARTVRCKQDVNARFPLGALGETPIREVWAGARHYYIDHCRARYDQYCTICDEYYTYNF
jgi:spiro-SPASM protein